MIITFYDTETSGLDVQVEDIHQFAYLLYDTNTNLVTRANSFYMWEDNYRWSEGAAKVNGLSREFLKSAGSQDMENKYKEIFVVMSRAREAGYNNDHYDRPLVDSFMRRHSFAPEPAQKSFDVMKIFKQSFGKRYKLVDLCAKLNITPEFIERMCKIFFKREGTVAHDAAYDTTATFLCFDYARRNGYVQV